MKVDLIKEYLIGLGFQINEDSFGKAKKSMDEADKKINEFNKNSQEGFSDTGKIMKDLFTLFKSSGGDLGKMFPELKEPLQGFIKTIALIKKTYVDLVKQMESQNPKIKIETEQETKSIHNVNNADNSNNTDNSKSSLPSVRLKSTEAEDSVKDLVNGMTDVKNAASGLAEEGGASLEALSSGAVEATGAITGLGIATGGIAIAVAAVVAIVAEGVKKLGEFLGGLAKQDIEYEKLSRQLWTTKENAKEVDMALKTMGATMQDLWLSPTLLKQFNQLRKDSKELKLPKEYTENLKVIQGIGTEFSRLKQLAQLAFQWIGNYILKYAAGPLNDLRQIVHSFNEWIIKNIPNIGKVIGGILGVLIRIIEIVVKIGAVLFKLGSPIYSIIKLISQIKESFDKLPESTQKTIKSIIAILVMLTNPLLLIIALLDDLFTYFKGGKSLTGTFIDKVCKAFDGMRDKIKNIVNWVKKLKDEFLNSSIVKWIEGVWEGLQKAIKTIEDLLTGNFKDLLGDLSIKINSISGENANRMISNYSTSNITNANKTNTTTTTNSNNSIKNDNKIYVYGGNDANATCKAVKNHVTGISIRGFQGVY